MNSGLKRPSERETFGRVRGTLRLTFGILSKRRGKKLLRGEGFTLLELLIVMAIMATLAAIGLIKYKGFIEETKEKKAISDINEIANLIEQFKEENERYPASLDELGKGTFLDPWGHPYQYVNISDDDKKNADKQQARKDRNQKPINTYYDLWSNGADGEFQKQVNGEKSRDDIIRAWDGMFVGLGKDLDELYGKPRQWRHPTDDTPPVEAPVHGKKNK
jgi:general secretion pathway protein G